MLHNLKKITGGTVLTVFSILCPSQMMAQSVDRPAKLFIKHGLQFQTWTFSGGWEWPRATTSSKWYNKSVALNNQKVRYVRLQLPNSKGQMNVAEVQVMSNGSNIAIGKTARQSSTYGDAVASRAIDGTTNGNWSVGSISRTQVSSEPWWEVDLGASYPITSINVFNQTNADVKLLRGYHLMVSENPFPSDSLELCLQDDNVSLISSHFAVGDEYTNLPFVQDYYEMPTYNIKQFQQHPDMKWGLEKAPYGDQLSTAPTANELANGFLCQKSLDNLDNLVSMGFGDEENWSSDRPALLKKWYDLCKEKYPNVLLHNNQWVGQWGDANMGTYIRTSKPDFISFDNYIFSEDQRDFGGGSLRPMYNNLGIYRRLALQGTDGKGEHPIEFGQYLIGFRQGGGQAAEGGNYYTSESQINCTIYGSLAMGAKWLSAWRYTGGGKSYWVDDNGNTLPGYTFYADALKEFKNLSPYLSRLHTTDFRIILGEHKYNGTVYTNSKPGEVSEWSSLIDPYITGIKATNQVATTNDGLRGDVVIGYFKPVKNIDTDPDVEMAPIRHNDDIYFMLVNGLTKATIGNEHNTSPNFISNVAAGACNKTIQRIRVDIDFGKAGLDTLVRISRVTGEEEDVQLTHVDGTKYYFETELGGGKGDLYYWRNAQHAPISTNLALNKPSTESAVNGGGAAASRANDGNTNGNYDSGSVAHTKNGAENWWQVDLGNVYNIQEVHVFNRTDCCGDRVSKYHIFVSKDNITATSVADVKKMNGIIDKYQDGQAGIPSIISINGEGRYVRLQLTHNDNPLNVAEIEVYGLNQPITTGIANAQTNNKITKIGCYSLDGKKLSNPEGGINIIVSSNGKANKVISK